MGHLAKDATNCADTPCQQAVGAAEADYLGYSFLLAGKTPWDVGPVARFDVMDLEAFKRWTFGGYWGGPKEAVRAMVTYEMFEDEAGTHDHRVFLWSQVRF